MGLIILWIKNSIYFVFGIFLHSFYNVFFSEILSSSLSSASNVVVTVQLEDQKKISVFLVSRMATEIAEYTLTFKGSVLAVSNVTSTKILIGKTIDV